MIELPPCPHAWAVSPRRAIAIQKELSKCVRRSGSLKTFRFIAGVDAAFTPDGGGCLAGVVLWDLDDNAAVEEHVAVRKLRFPYVPGLLTFREGPALLAALRKLSRRPDALMCDGHGLAHPRRFGIACHLGVVAGIPSVGCAKSRLVGIHREPGPRRGARAPLVHEGERVGTVLRTRDNVRPVYASIGHRVDLATAEKLILDSGQGYRLPEPTRLADQLVARAKRETG